MVLARAIGAGVLVALAGTTPWAFLSALNLKFGAAVPWSVLPAGVWLWLCWRYAGGKGPPRSTSGWRRQSLRAHALSQEVWGAAITAGILGLAALVAFERVLARMIVAPAAAPQDLSKASAVTLFAMLAMGSAVAGLMEEAAFRGYMQGPLEKRYGFAAAVAISGAIFGAAHFSHPGVGAAMLPYYVAVSAVYGGLAYETGSILPGVALHAGGNLLGGLPVVFGARDWTQTAAPAERARLIWETGPDAALWIGCALAAALGVATAFAYRGVGRIARARQTYEAPNA